MYLSEKLIMSLRRYDYGRNWEISDVFAGSTQKHLRDLDRFRRHSLLLEKARCLKRLRAWGGEGHLAFRLTAKGKAILDKSRLLQLSVVRVTT